MNTTPTPPRGAPIDRVGMVASGACIVHCALCVLLPGALGAMGLLGHEVEWAFVLTAVSFAAIALALGWQKHRSSTVGLTLSFGILGLLGARYLEERSLQPWGILIGVLAGVVLISGHIANLRAIRCDSVRCS